MCNYLGILILFNTLPYKCRRDNYLYVSGIIISYNLLCDKFKYYMDDIYFDKNILFILLFYKSKNYNF